MTLALAVRIRDSRDGVAAIEFCLTLPVLLLMTLGVFDVSQVITRRLDYQQAAAETIGLALAQPPQATGSLAYLRSAASASAGVPLANVTVTRQVRCNNVDTMNSACALATDFALYVNVSITGTYTPIWGHFAVDREIAMRFDRTVRIR